MDQRSGGRERREKCKSSGGVSLLFKIDVIDKNILNILIESSSQIDPKINPSFGIYNQCHGFFYLKNENLGGSGRNSAA